MAVALPVDEQIVVDGDLSDWPAHLPSYPIRQTAYGYHPTDEKDLSASFRVAYSRDGAALYVAVEVRDESVVLDTTGAHDWDTRDGCEVYFGTEHGKGIRQHLLFGPDYYGSEGEVVRQWGAGMLVYEWRIGIDAPVALSPGQVVELDVAVIDKDADGSLSWVAWGRGVEKVSHPERSGDLILLSPETELGVLRGSITDEEGEGWSRGKLHLEGLDNGPTVVVMASGNGEFSAHLPIGRYQVSTGAEGQTAAANVTASGASEVAPLVAPVARGVQVKAGPGRSVAAGPGVTRHAWRTFGIADGMSSLLVHAILQDRKGDIWFGTQQGATRFDGHELTTFSRADGLPAGTIQSIFEDRSGDMWFGSGWFNVTGHGVARYDGETVTTYTTADGLVHNSVECIAQDRSGQMWFGTYGGVSRFDGKRFTNYTVEDGLADNPVQSIVEDRNGTMWFGTGFGRSGGIISGLTRYDGERFETFRVEDGLPGNWIDSLLEDGAGNLWIGTHNKGLARYDGETFHALGSDSPGIRIWAMDEGDDGSLWFGTEKGISSYREGQWSVEASIDGYPHVDVYSLLVDRNGHIWNSTAGGKIGMFSGRHSCTFTTEDGLTSNDVTRITEDSRGNIWILTGLAVSRWDGERFHIYSSAVGLPGDVVRHVFEDTRGHLWFATSAGATRYDGHAYTNFTTEDGLPHNSTLGVLEDSRGNIWVWTRGGVGVYNGERFTAITVKDGLPHNRVGTMLEDGQGNVWIGTPGGLSRYDGTDLTTYTTRDVLPAGYIFPTLVDSKGGVWLQTLRGMARFTGRDFQMLAPFIGLPLPYAATVEDDEGAVWCPSAGGVARYTMHDGKVILTTLLCVSVIEYTVQDGPRYSSTVRSKPQVAVIRL